MRGKEYEVKFIPLKDIWVDSTFNCRSIITPQSVESLADSIKDFGRLRCPVDLQPIKEIPNAPKNFKYRLICGFRRYMACSLLKWKTIPAYIYEGLTERQASMMNFTENLERKDLNILEEALHIDKLFPAYRTISSIAEELNRADSWVSVRRHLLTMPKFVQHAAGSGRLRQTDLQRVMKSNNPEELARQILRLRKHGIVPKQYGKWSKPKAEVKEMIAKLLKEGFSPHLLRLMGWSIGEVSTKDFEHSLTWLRDRKGWLK